MSQTADATGDSSSEFGKAVPPAGAGSGNLGAIHLPWVATNRIAFLDVTHGAIDEPTLVTFANFEARSAAVAAGLIAAGLSAGSRIGILSDNSVDFAATYFAIPRVGMVSVPLNSRQPSENLTFVAVDAAMMLVFHDAANTDRLPAGVPSIEFGSQAWSDFLAAGAAPPPVAAVTPESVAVQMYTSGSTGRPKGVLLTHGGQLFSIDQYLGGVMPMDPDERLLISAPLYHKNAQMQLKMALCLGGSVVLLRRFDAEHYLRAIERHDVTAMTGVPTMFALMFGRRDLLGQLDRSSVRRLSIGSAPMTQALFDQARSLFPDAVITNGYGTTEVVAVFGGHPEGAPRPDIAVGHPLAAIETRIVDPQSGVDAEPDPETGRRQGELWIRSPGMMLAYHGMPEVTAQKLTDGWYHTGDVMEADELGWHYFVGRVDDMFSCAGENVYPGDVEQMLERCPLVHQAAVVSVVDELKGSLPVAFVVLAIAGAEADWPQREEDIKQWALANGPAYQHPRAVWFLAEIPLAGTAKIDKAALAAEAARRWVPRAEVRPQDA